MIINKAGDWLAAKVGDELVMMSVEKGRYIGLSEVGSRVWEVLDETPDFDGVCAKLMGEFDVTAEVCRAEVKTFLDELKEQGAVTIEE